MTHSKTKNTISCVLFSLWTSTVDLLQHASDMLPLLESAPALQWLLLPLSFLQAGIPLEDSGCTRGHAASLHLAGILLLLPVGDLWLIGFLPVSSAYLGSADGSAAHLQDLEGTRSKSH